MDTNNVKGTMNWVVHVGGALSTNMDAYHVQVEGDGKCGRDGEPYG